MKITKSQVQVLRAPADEALVDVQPKSGGMRAFVTLKMMTDEGIEGIGLTFAPALGLSPLAPALKSAVDALCGLVDWLERRRARPLRGARFANTTCRRAGAFGHRAARNSPRSARVESLSIAHRSWGRAVSS